MFDLAWLNHRRRRYLSAARGPLHALLQWRVAKEALESPSALLALDLELTGLDPQRDAIVCLGWVPVRNRRILLGEARRNVVRSPTSVGTSATIHHLRDCDLEQGRDLQGVLTEVLEALAGHTLLIHGGIDLPFLDRACKDIFGAPLAVPVLDTAFMARRQHQRAHRPLGRGGLTLPRLRSDRGLPPVAMHDALGDAVATAELYLAMTA